MTNVRIVSAFSSLKIEGILELPAPLGTPLGSLDEETSSLALPRADVDRTTVTAADIDAALLIEWDWLRSM